GCDELGGLAMAMRTMVNQVRTVRVLAERLALMFVLIGRGTLPSPMEGTFQGEFKAVGTALNQAMDTLSALLALAEPLQRLAHHEPTQPVDENRYPGDFKVLARAVNQLIHQQKSGS
ncbi:MAG: hypothetical protein HQL80_12685, partial [Magnetococcales bacterium]|nr:hypothetical protein [Magnetococcales bacterium]